MSYSIEGQKISEKERFGDDHSSNWPIKSSTREPLMLSNILKIIFRNFSKEKAFTLINVTGLTLGLAAFLLISLYVIDEMSYDRFYPSADNIYRVRNEVLINGNGGGGVTTPPVLAETIVAEMPEVAAATRIFNAGFPVIEYGENSFSEERYFWADSSFFDVFEAEFIYGQAEGALDRPNTVVFTESMVLKYFGELINPVGLAVTYKSTGNETEITGVIKDPPDNTHFPFEFLCSLASYPQILDNTSWVNNFIWTYIRLAEGTDMETVQAKLPAFTALHASPEMTVFGAADMADFNARGNIWEHHLQPLTSIHLHSNYTREIIPNGNATSVNMFIIVAVFILLLACINYVNLSTARSLSRAKEIGVRKILGAPRRDLITQFLTESIVLTQVAVGLAIVLVALILPSFNVFAAKQLTIGMNNPLLFAIALVGVAIIVGIAAGSYPAMLLSSFNPIYALKGQANPGSSNIKLRNLLVVAQFTIGIGLVIGTLIVYSQLNYIQNKDLGFDRDDLLVIEKVDDLGGRTQPFKDEILKIVGVQGATSTFNLIGGAANNQTMQLEGKDDSFLIWNFPVDHDFAETYKLDMAQGRYFQRDFATDSMSTVINETAYRQMGLETLEGAAIILNANNPEFRRRLPIIGVVKDFHFETLRDPIQPFAFFMWGLFGNNNNYMGRNLSIRLRTDDWPAMLSSIEEVWKEFAGIQAFEYQFFDDYFDDLYRTEQSAGVVFASFAGLAIIIACLGLFGLASHTAERRTKEIGVRKVLGASESNLVLLLVRDTVYLVIIAVAIAGPIAYLVMSEWLTNFAYRADIGAITFIVAAIGALIIAIVTVSYQAIKVAVDNPINALRYE
jgi:putative ABC transport system permease protein